MKEKMKKILKYVGVSLCIIALLFSTVCNVWNLVKPEFEDNTKYMVYEEMTRLQYDSAKLVLVRAVDTYIQKVAPYSAVHGIAVVNASLNHNIDLCFVLAQMQKESHFATTGQARKSNSICNVKAYSDSYAKNYKKRPFDTPDESIEPYLCLLDESYLVDGKTEYDMLNKFVDKYGHRYAQDKDYESALTSLYQSIKTTTPIDSMAMVVKSYGVILGY